MSVRLDEHAYAPCLLLGSIGLGLIRLGFALRTTTKEIR